MNPIAQEELKALEERLQESYVDIDIDLKKRVYEILSDIQYRGIKKENMLYGSEDGEYPMPGMIIVLGCEGIKDSDYHSVPNDAQNIFRYGNPLADELGLTGPVDVKTELGKRVLESVKYFDSAILINLEGYITDTGVRIESLSAKKVLKEKGIPNDRDLSRRFGFVDGVANRHMTAICASWELNKIGDVTMYSLSRRTAVIRVYEKGDILYSQKPGEPERLVPPEAGIQTQKGERTLQPVG